LVLVLLFLWVSFHLPTPTCHALHR
jgi:hypothetical protein